MPIRVICSCGKKLVAPDAAAGKRAKCPACGNRLQISPPAAIGLPSPSSAALPQVTPPPVAPPVTGTVSPIVSPPPPVAGPGLDQDQVSAGAPLQVAPPPSQTTTANVSAPTTRSGRRGRPTGSGVAKGAMTRRTWAIVAAAALLIVALPIAFFAMTRGESGEIIATVIDAMPSDAYRIDELEKKAGQGSAQSQVDLGKIYYHGQGVEQDLFLARNWFEKAGKQNYAEANYLIARMHFGGEAGLSKSNNEGIAYLKKAASANYLPAILELGKIYREGLRDASVDWKAAEQYFSQAAKLGSDQGASEVAALAAMQKQELSKTRGMTTERLASHITIEDVDHEHTYHTYTTDTYIKRQVPDLDLFVVEGGEKKSTLQGALVKGTVHSAFKHARVRVQLRISFDTDAFKQGYVAGGFDHYDFPKKSFSENVSGIVLEPGDRIYFQRFVTTTVTGVNYRFSQYREYDIQSSAHINAGTLTVSVESVELIRD